MQDGMTSILKQAKRAESMLNQLSEQITLQKKEFAATEFHQTYSKAALAKFPLLTRALVDKAMSEMESAGYDFPKKKSGSSETYALTIQNVVDIYKHRSIPAYRDKHSGCWVIFVGNLKGGVAKTVTTVSLAHGMKTHDALLKEDLRVLVLDLDPQSSSTMFLKHDLAIGLVDNTVAQAMLHKLTREELLDEFIQSSAVPGVDLIPASIDDGFIAEDWAQLCAEHLPDQNPYSVLKENVIDPLSTDYDFIFVDSGPHLDSFLKNALVACDLMLTPIPPAQVDFHSTLKYLHRLPSIIEDLSQSGSEPNIKGNIGFMSKLANKADHKLVHSLTKEIFGGDTLDATLPKLDGFERCGESFDTVITANPKNYPGSREALKSAKAAASDFSKAVFDRIEFLRSEAI